SAGGASAAPDFAAALPPGLAAACAIATGPATARSEAAASPIRARRAARRHAREPEGRRVIPPRYDARRPRAPPVIGGAHHALALHALDHARGPVVADLEA